MKVIYFFIKTNSIFINDLIRQSLDRRKSIKPANNQLIINI